jgi:hypothetical protein
LELGTLRRRPHLHFILALALQLTDHPETPKAALGVLSPVIPESHIVLGQKFAVLGEFYNKNKIRISKTISADAASQTQFLEKTCS